MAMRADLSAAICPYQTPSAAARVGAADAGSAASFYANQMHEMASEGSRRWCFLQERATVFSLNENMTKNNSARRCVTAVCTVVHNNID